MFLRYPFTPRNFAPLRILPVSVEAIPFFQLFKPQTLESFMTPLFISHQYPAWQQLVALPPKYSPLDHFPTLYYFPTLVLTSSSHLACLSQPQAGCLTHYNPYSIQQPEWCFKILGQIISCVCSKPCSDSPVTQTKWKQKSFRGRESLTWSAPYTWHSLLPFAHSAPATLPLGNLPPQGLCINLTLCLGALFPQIYTHLNHSPSSQM